jgi:argininosuccinate lyase
MRLWLMKEAREIETALKALIQVIVNRADKEREILMPGYTHLQVSPRLIIIGDQGD